jgi:plasmid stability protein
MQNTQLACTIGPVAKTIQIRNVPDDVHRALRTQAAAAGKSLSDYLLAHVEDVAARPANAEIFRRASERARGSGVSTEEIIAAVRSGRDRD